MGIILSDDSLSLLQLSIEIHKALYNNFTYKDNPLLLAVGFQKKHVSVPWLGRKHLGLLFA